MHHEKLSELRFDLGNLWDRELCRSKFINFIRNNSVPKNLYAQYLIETYHYTQHNALNQALVGARTDVGNFAYQRFCFHHAAEEVGHQMMALNDINNMGYRIEESELPKALPQTTVLIAYLYWISTQGNPIQRLGYSFWAENCYSYIAPILKKVRDDLQLSDKHMSFFVAHAEIDSDHAAEVERIIKKVCVSDKDHKDLAEVMETSLRLTVDMMDAVFNEYQALINDASDRATFLESRLYEQ